MPEQPTVSVIILTWNGKQDTIECLDSLKKITYSNVKIIVVDNASTDGTGQELGPRQDEIELVVNPSNLRFAGGNNVGIKKAMESNSDYILLLNNDTIVDPNFLSEMIAVAESDNKIGMVGPKIYYYSDRKRLWYAGGKIEWWKGWISHIGIREIDRGQYDQRSQTDYITGCCVLVRREVIEKIGLLDDAYYIYGEDADWSVRAVGAGFKLMYAPDGVIWHKLSVSTGGNLSWFKNWNKLKSQFRFLIRYARWYHWLTIPPAIFYNILSSYLKTRRLNQFFNHIYFMGMC